MNVGVLGGGQLGRMLALAGYPLGLAFRFYEPAPGPPVSGLGTLVSGAYADLDAAREFARGLDVVTYEFENVPVETARALTATVPVYPPPGALELAQDRFVEKTGFRDLGIPTVEFEPVDTRESLDQAVLRIGLPAVLKTRRMGYDGKGQAVLRSSEDVDGAWGALGGRALILEAWAEYERELSVLGVRNRSGETRFYPLIETRHGEGILRWAFAPAPVSASLQAQARRYAADLMDHLGYVGVLALELFDTDGGLLANEIAPRVHNSGHWTQDGAAHCQFENHMRAVCGFPLGDTAARGYTAMVNLLGSPPSREAVLSLEGAHLHLYGKTPRPRRKIGHVNVHSEDAAHVRDSIDRIRALPRA